MPGLARASGFLAVVDDGEGVAGVLAEMLENRGVRARVTREPAEASESYGVLYLGGLRKVREAGAAIAINQEAFLWARAVGERLAAENGLFVTVQDTGGDFGLGGQLGVLAWAGGLPALVKTAALEWPACELKAIDVECDGLEAREIANRVLEELCAGGPEIEVGLKFDGSRITLVGGELPSDDRRPPSPSRWSVRQELTDSVLVVSGGGRGVTAACLNALASEVKVKLVLLGRTSLVPESFETRGAQSEVELTRLLFSESNARGESPLPKELKNRARSILARREILETIDALESKGALVKYIEVDVQDEAELRSRLAEVRREWGPVCGIIHAAGVIADKPIVEKSPEQFSKVFRTKVEGLRALLKATEDDPLRLICLFSSVAARAGNVGQSDYAMGNEVLNRVARSDAIRRRDCRVKSIGWGAWDGGMVTPELRRHFEQHGVPLIPVELGARHFVHELSLPEPEVVVVPRNAAVGLDARTTRSREMEVQSDQSHLPCLADHVIAGAPVVPVAFVLEWFLRAARGCRPDLAVVSIDELHVMKGIRLAQFGKTVNRLRLSVSEVERQDGPTEGLQMRAFLKSEEGMLSYKAVIKMQDGATPDGSALDELIEASRPEADALIRTELSVADSRSGAPKRVDAEYDPYEEHLFHGPAFQSIARVESLTDTGVVVQLKSLEAVAEMTARNGDATAAPILLDAGFQAARLWGIRMTGRKTLPMSVDRFLTSTCLAPVRCAVIGRSYTEMRTVTDIYFIGDSQRVVAALLGVEMYVANDEAHR